MPPIPDQGRRVALVIGNSAYKDVPPLTNPKLDAEAVAAGLKSDGFDVSLVTDVGFLDMSKALREFRDKADDADWAVIYFAGHGIEVGGANYLIPVDAVLRSNRDMDDEAIPLTRVFDRLDRVKKLAIVVVDSCREDPFQAKITDLDHFRSVSRGLARIEPEHRHQLVVYSARENKLAEDGSSDGHSPFAKAFLSRLSTPGLEVNRMFRFVTDDVMTATNGSQEPTMYGSTGTDDYYFKLQ